MNPRGRLCVRLSYDVDPPCRRTGGSLPENISYCGVAPVPADIWTSWNLDPVLLAALGLLAIGYVATSRTSTALQRGCFWSAWLMLVALFVSPLCAWSSALFSVRVAH